MTLYQTTFDTPSPVSDYLTAITAHAHAVLVGDARTTIEIEADDEWELAIAVREIAETIDSSGTASVDIPRPTAIDRRRNAVDVLREIAALTQDGEVREPGEDPYIMENDDAVDTLNSLIADARRMLGLPEAVTE